MSAVRAWFVRLRMALGGCRSRREEFAVFHGGEGAGSEFGSWF
ncbi:hypothetical protein ACFQS3_25175 [Glycomyces mayteni]|uniref:Uncharacterized protein n=1 Tax=Glycomyces mayteni TaxID=543887 RepID=A0ABW2DHU2_9ACTN